MKLISILHFPVLKHLGEIIVDKESTAPYTEKLANLMVYV